MSSMEWEKIKEIFYEALGREPEGRVAFLEESCGSNAALRAEVESLLECEQPAQEFIEEPAVSVGPLTDAPGAIQAGEPIGSYKVIREIGRGGMGVVYLAEREVGGLVAIKILPNNAFTSPARRQRFASEQRTLAGLNHQYIAQLYDLDVLNDGTPWFAMEYVDGISITQYCEGRPIEECLRLFKSACEAVKYAHGRMIIHRDLKPSNILVKSDSDVATVKLLDFGIAKQLEVSDTSNDLTLPALRLLTPSYAAPELFHGSGLFQADVYSLGVILYVLLAGQLPITTSNKTPTEIERMKKETDVERPSVVAKRNETAGLLSRPANTAGSWADLDVLCLKAIAGELDQRYESVEALLADIDRYLANQPLKARPITIRYKLAKFTKRHRVGVVTTAIVLALIVGLVTFFMVRLTRARNEALRAAARTQRIQRFMVNLLAGGDKGAGPSADLRVVTIIDQGVREAQSLDREPIIQAELFNTLGNSYRNLGIFDQADVLLRSALDHRRALLGPDDPQVAESLVSLGLLRADQGKNNEAEQMIRAGLEKMRRARPYNESEVAIASTALGKVLSDRGEYDEAIHIVEEVVRMQSAAAPPSPELSASLRQLADANFYAGHYETSDLLNQRLLVLDQQLFGDRHISVANDYMNLGAIQVQWGHFKGGEQLYRQGLQITQDWYRKDHPQIEADLIQLGQTLTFQERYDEAERLLHEALEMDKRIFPGGHPRIAYALNELGSLETSRGSWAAAEDYFRRAIEIDRAAYGEVHLQTITAMSNLAGIYYKQKDYAQAERILADVVANFTKLAPDSLNVGISKIKHGRTLMRLNRYQEAEAETLSGYENVMKQKSPIEGWATDAREVLVAIYEGLKEPEKAAKIRAELQKQ